MTEPRCDVHRTLLDDDALRGLVCRQCDAELEARVLPGLRWALVLGLIAVLVYLTWCAGV